MTTPHLAGTVESEVWVWDATTGEKEKIFKTDSHRIVALSWSPDGQMIAAGSLDNGEIYLWQVDSNKPALVFQDGTQITSVSWSRRGDLLAVSNLPQGVHIWDIHGKKFLHRLNAAGEVSFVTWNPESDILATGGGFSGSEGVGPQYWDSKGRKLLQSVDSGADYLLMGRWNADGTRIATADIGGTVSVWEMKVAHPLQTFVGSNFDFYSNTLVNFMAWSPNNELAIVTADNHIKVWDITKGKELYDLACNET